MARFFPYDASMADLTTPCKPPFFNGWQPAKPDALCAELARLAYCEGDAVKNALAPVGFSLVAEISEPSGTGTYGILVRNDRTAVLAFRGTQPDDMSDIMDDANILPMSWETGGKVHSGFANALLRVRDQVARLLGAETLPVIMTGHSLGAAVATLAASLFHPKLLVTFGSPHVGDTEFCQGLTSAVSINRYVDCCDIVCQLPPDFLPIGQLHYIDFKGEILLEPTNEAIVFDQVAGQKDYLLNYAFLPGAATTRNLADHSPINYVSALVGV
jgi:hypothetical protein